MFSVLSGLGHTRSRIVETCIVVVSTVKATVINGSTIICSSEISRRPFFIVIRYPIQMPHNAHLSVATLSHLPFPNTTFTLVLANTTSLTHLRQIPLR